MAGPQTLSRQSPFPDDEVELTLTTAATHTTANVLVSYTAGTNPLQNAAGDPAADFSDEDVENDTPETAAKTSQNYPLGTLANLDLVFARQSQTSANAGHWIVDEGMSTGSASTGPGLNSLGPYVYSETSGGSQATIPGNSELHCAGRVLPVRHRPFDKDTGVLAG